LGLVADKSAKKKTQVNHEPRSAHGRAVYNKPRVVYEPRAVKKIKKIKKINHG